MESVSNASEMQLEVWLKAGPMRLGFKPVFFVFEFQWGKVVRAKRAAASWLATILSLDNKQSASNSSAA